MAYEEPSKVALEVALIYLRARLKRPPYPPDVTSLARLIDTFYLAHYPTNPT